MENISKSIAEAAHEMDDANKKIEENLRKINQWQSWIDAEKELKNENNDKYDTANHRHQRLGRIHAARNDDNDPYAEELKKEFKDYL